MRRGEEGRRLIHSTLFPRPDEIFATRRWRLHTGLTLCLLWLKHASMRPNPLSRPCCLPARDFPWSLLDCILVSMI